MRHIYVKFPAFFTMIYLLTGCIASHYGNMAGSASLGSPNFVYTSHNLVGEAQATYVLGIGGAARQSLVLEAKKAMMENYQLRDNQALANLSVSYKTTGFFGFLVTTVICTVSADIVEFGATKTDFSQKQPDSKTMSSPTHVPAAEKGLESVTGDQVWIINYFNKPVEGKIIEKTNNGYLVEYKNSSNKTRKVTVLEYQIERK